LTLAKVVGLVAQMTDTFGSIVTGSGLSHQGLLRSVKWRQTASTLSQGGGKFACSMGHKVLQNATEIFFH